MQIRIKPAAGLTIKKPDGSKLAADGEVVPRNSFWIKRLADGDVTYVGLTVTAGNQQAEQPASKATHKKTEK